MYKKAVKKSYHGFKYLFDHPVRRIITIFSILIMSFITYCSVCLPSDFDTSKEGWMGVLATALLRPLELNGISRLVAVGNSGGVYFSLDGGSWSGITIAPAGVTFTSVIYTGLNYVAAGGQVGSCSIYYSSNGIDWSPSSLPVCNDKINALAFGGGKIIAVGGLVTYGSNGLILTSVNHGISWTASSGPAIEFTHIVFDGNYFLAAGNTSLAPNIYRSTAGVISFAAAPFNFPFSSFKTPCYLGRMYNLPGSTRVVASGSSCASLANPSTSSYTTNSAATAWNLNAADIFGGTASPPPVIARGLAYGNGRLVAVGDFCRVDISLNPLTALNWTLNTTMSGCTSPTTWSDLVFDGNKFIAVGEYRGVPKAGVMAVSATGNPADWSITTTGITLVSIASR